MDNKVSTSFAMVVILLAGLIPVWLIIFNFGQGEYFDYQETMPNNEIGPKIDISNWKTYQNEAFNYLLKYPADWEIVTKGLAPAETFSAPTFQSPECAENNNPVCIHLSVGHIHRAGPIETIESDIPLGAGTDYTINQKQKIKVGGEDALLVEYFQKSYGRKNGEMGKARQQIKVLHGGWSYLISIDQENTALKKLDSSASWKKQSVLREMLGSFQFTR